MATKTAAKSKAAAKKSTAPAKKGGKVRFPKRELNTWLRKHQEWDDQAWNNLLDELTLEHIDRDVNVADVGVVYVGSGGGSGGPLAGVHDDELVGWVIACIRRH